MFSPLPVYVINLARRPDRLRAIAQRLGAAGLAFERIDAFDAQIMADAAIDAHFAPDTGFGKGDRCCTLSHLRLFERLANSSDDYAIVLEDDAVFDAKALRRLLDPGWLPRNVDLVKIEAYGPVHRKIIIGRRLSVFPGVSIARLHRKHTGAGGYIISRRLASWLLAHSRPLTMPIDHLLFNPLISPVFHRIRPYQLLPAVVRQFDINTDSDIAPWRTPERRSGRAFLNHELRRFVADVAALPHLALRRWRFVSITSR
jgi:glycosyl transferase family 25